MKVRKSDYLKTRRHSQIAARLVINALNDNPLIRDTDEVEGVLSVELSMSAKYQTVQIVVIHKPPYKATGSLLVDAVEETLEEMDICYGSEEMDGYTVVGYEE